MTPALEPRAAYRLWAPTYAAETAVSFLDTHLCAALSPPVEGRRLLDAGCGIGRRLPRGKAARAVGIDASPEMLAAGGRRDVAAADVRCLPFSDESFDLVWCRLVLGHIADPQKAYAEFARVLAPGGMLLVTDFHADAARAGARRTFRDRDGTVHEVEHHIHDASAHAAMAAACGLALEIRRDGHVGPVIRDFYDRAGRLDIYERDLGQSLVAAFLFRRPCA